MQHIPATTVYVHGVDTENIPAELSSHPASTVTVPGVLHVKVPDVWYVCLLHVVAPAAVHPSVIVHGCVCVCVCVCVAFGMFACCTW
jgi:hypothetical protein